MQDDSYGELHPVVDNQACVQCGLCQKVCPNNHLQEFNYPLACYASWITDKPKRRICASGGIGTIMSEYIIDNCKGVVIGSRYNDDMTPVMTYTEQIEELERFKGSRYVQSKFLVETYNQIKIFLKSGRKVMFVGTPCQVAGLKGFLRKDWDNLITVDLICHGCSPTSYLKDEVSYICKQNHLAEISDIRFRGNDGNNFTFSLWGKVKLLPKGRRCSYYQTETTKRLYYKRACTSYYLAGFLLGVTLRDNCYQCPYARPERISDITIGDFIGLGKQKPFNYSKINVSSVMVNTEKGKTFYDKVSEAKKELVNIMRDYSERLEYKPSLVEPFAKHPLASVFREEYLKEGYIHASRKVLAGEVEKSELEERRSARRRIIIWPYLAAKKTIKIILYNWKK